MQLIEHTQAAELMELRKLEDAKRRALEQKAVQTQQLEELKVGVGVGTGEPRAEVAGLGERWGIGRKCAGAACASCHHIHCQL